jgi:hypothetical protein
VNFIERYFGVSPDGGDSSLEVMLLVLLVLIVVAIGMHLSYWRKNKKTKITSERDVIKGWSVRASRQLPAECPNSAMMRGLPWPLHVVTARQGAASRATQRFQPKAMFGSGRRFPPRNFKASLVGYCV